MWRLLLGPRCSGLRGVTRMSVGAFELLQEASFAMVTAKCNRRPLTDWLAWPRAVGGCGEDST